MKCTVQANGTNNYTEQNRTISGFLLSIVADAASSVTLAVEEDITISAVLQREGQPAISVVSGNLFALSRTNPGSYEGEPLDAHGTTKGYYITLGGSVLQLSERDQLQVTLRVGTAVAGMTTTIATEYKPGVELYTPIVTVIPIDKTRAVAPLNLGNFVNAIKLVCTTMNDVITGLNINSNIWECSYDISEFNALQADQWPWGDAKPTFRSLSVYNDVDLQKVSGSANINVAAVGNAYLVAFAGLQDVKKARQGMETLQKISMKEQGFLGLGKRFMSNH